MKELKKYVFAGIIFVSAVGTLLHFAYDWSGNNVFVGIFTPVNESIWEHTKLIFFPLLVYSMYLNKKISTQYPCISSAMTFGGLLGVVLIIALFYTYSGIVGFHTAFADMSIFYISAIMSFYAVYSLTLSCNLDKYNTLLRFSQIILICLYVIFTFFPLRIPLFISQ